MILRDKLNLHRAIPMSVSSQRISVPLSIPNSQRNCDTVSLGGEKRGGVKNYESGTVGRIETRPYSSMRSSRWLPPQCFSKSRLFLLIQPVDVPALIQLADKSHVDEILWLGCLS